jgi:hyperosmotically inducible periplasmic protein
MKAQVAIAALGAALFTLAACDRETATRARQEAETVGRKVDQALDRTQEKLASAGEKLQPKLDAAGRSIAEAGDKVAATVRDAATPEERPRGGAEAPGSGTATNGSGASTTTTVTTGPRTTVTGIAPATRASLGDAAITASIKADFLKDRDLSVLKIDVDTRDGVVTLNGLAENEAARERAGRLASGIKGVREVRNHLTVKRG